MSIRRIATSLLALGTAACASNRTAPISQALDARGLPTPDASSVAAREQTADQQVLHALNRLAYGARPGDVQAVRELGIDRWIALQLEPSRVPDVAGDAVIARYRTLGLPLPSLLSEYPPNPVLRRLARQAAGGMSADSMRVTRQDSMEYAVQRRRSQLVGLELSSARVSRAVVSERQLDEVLADFWLNHFNVLRGQEPGDAPLPRGVRTRCDSPEHPRHISHAARRRGAQPGDAVVSRQLARARRTAAARRSCRSASPAPHSADMRNGHHNSPACRPHSATHSSRGCSSAAVA